MTCPPMPSVDDDFVVTTNGRGDETDGPDAVGMTALALLHLKASALPTTQLFTSGRGKRRDRAIRLDGGWWNRLRCMMTGRIVFNAEGMHDPSLVRLTGEDIHYAWTSYGTAWTMRISLPDGAPIPSRRDSWPIAEAFIDLAIEAMRRLSDETERERGRTVSIAIERAAKSAAAQLPAGTVLACPGPRGPIGPELGNRGGFGDEHTHGASIVLRDRLEAEHPPCIRAWFSHSKGYAGRRPTEESRHLGLHGDYAIAVSPHDAMERMRALTLIPEGERWFR